MGTGIHALTGIGAGLVTGAVCACAALKQIAELACRNALRLYRGCNIGDDVETSRARAHANISHAFVVADRKLRDIGTYLSVLEFARHYAGTLFHLKRVEIGSVRFSRNAQKQAFTT